MRRKCEQDLESQKEKYEKTVIDIRYFYEKEKENLLARIDRLQAEIDLSKEGQTFQSFSEQDAYNPEDSYLSHFSVKISDLNDKCTEIRVKASNEILSLKQQKEELAKENKKLEEAANLRKTEVAEKQKKISLLNFKINKAKTNETKLTEKIKQLEIELESEKLARRKKRMKDKNEVTKVKNTN